MREPTSASPVARSMRTPSAVHGAERPGSLPSYESVRSIFSAVQRAGRWEVPDELEVRAIFGDVTLDFSEADLPPGGTIELDVWAICGHVKIVVPDGSEIEVDGTPILGSIEQLGGARPTRGAGGRTAGGNAAGAARDAARVEPPFFHVDGRAVLGAIEVMVR